MTESSDIGGNTSPRASGLEIRRRIRTAERAGLPPEVGASDAFVRVGVAGSNSQPAPPQTLSQLLADYNTIRENGLGVHAANAASAVRLQIFRQIFPNQQTAEQANSLYADYLALGGLPIPPQIEAETAGRLGALFGTREAELLTETRQHLRDGQGGRPNLGYLQHLSERLEALRALHPFRTRN